MLLLILMMVLFELPSWDFFLLLAPSRRWPSYSIALPPVATLVVLYFCFLQPAPLTEGYATMTPAAAAILYKQALQLFPLIASEEEEGEEEAPMQRST